jgi:hypothetical protein
MRVLVYAHRKAHTAALARCAELRAEGHTALLRDTRGFAGDIETCDRVLTDDGRVAAAHEARGIAVEPFTVLPDAPADLPAPKDSDGGTDEGEPVDNKPKRRGRRAAR